MITSNEFIRFGRSVAASRIVREGGNGQVRPSLFDGRDDTPLCLHLVSPGEKGRVSAHGIEQEGLVSRGPLGTERRFVRKVCIHRGRAHLAAGPLGIESNAYPLVWLNAQRDDIRPKLLILCAGEECLRGAFEMHTNFGKLSG